MTAVEKITVETEISSCPLFGNASRILVGDVIKVTPFDEGRFGTLYRYESSTSPSPLVIKLLHPGDDCRSIADLHSAIAIRAADFPAGWEALLRGMPFWTGKVKTSKGQTIALICLDLDVLGFVQLHRLLEKEWQKYFALDLGKRVRLACNFACSYAILEDLRFLHADVNSENLFVNLQTAEALLIDFDAGVLRLRGHEIPKSPGKPNEFLPVELKSATGADVSKYNEAAERWSVGFMISTLIFGIHPLFFLSHLSLSVIKKYVTDHQWPEIDLHSKISYVWHSPANQKQKAVRSYLHFVHHDLGNLEKLRPRAFVLMQRFINDGALTPQERPSALEWASALSEQKARLMIQERQIGTTSYCSFCSKSEREVCKLVCTERRKNAFICDECVGVSVELLQANGIDALRKADEGWLVYTADFSVPSRFREGILTEGSRKAFRNNGFYHIALIDKEGKSGNYYEWQTCDIPLKDFRVSVQGGFAPDFIKSTAKNACYGVVFRSNGRSIQNHYRFCITRDSYYCLDCYVSSERRVIIDWAHSGAIKEGDSLNTLTVCMRGNKITAAVNGKELLSVAHYQAGMEKGSVGLFVSRVFLDTVDALPEARFRNFLLYKLEG